MGGKGSGWHASAGHVPGSQGGHGKASKDFSYAGTKAGHAADIIRSNSSTNAQRASAMEHANTAHKAAMKSSSAVGSSQHFQAQAATKYMKDANEYHKNQQWDSAATALERASQAHHGMARNHEVMAKNTSTEKKPDYNSDPSRRRNK